MKHEFCIHLEVWSKIGPGTDNHVIRNVGEIARLVQGKPRTDAKVKIVLLTESVKAHQGADQGRAPVSSVHRPFLSQPLFSMPLRQPYFAKRGPPRVDLLLLP